MPLSLGRSPARPPELALALGALPPAVCLRLDLPPQVSLSQGMAPAPLSGAIPYARSAPTAS